MNNLKDILTNCFPHLMIKKLAISRKYNNFGTVREKKIFKIKCVRKIKKSSTINENLYFSGQVILNTIFYILRFRFIIDSQTWKENVFQRTNWYRITFLFIFYNIKISDTVYTSTLRAIGSSTKVKTVIPLSTITHYKAYCKRFNQKRKVIDDLKINQVETTRN